MKTCMFTGHRPHKLPFGYNEDDKRCTALKRRLTYLIRQKILSGVSRFLSGMALGTDCFAAEIVLSLRNEFPEVSLVAVIPCATQSSKWNKRQISRYSALLRQCDKVIVLQDEYTYDCMQKRNRYMVEQSDCVIAVWNGTSSGTSKTITYAVNKSLPVTILHPDTLSVQIL